jgi:hypothetical protein
VRLSELEPKFVKRTENGGYAYVDSIDEAEGIDFLCPKCFVANNGPVGTHGIICWRPNVPLSVSPGPGRWELRGTNFENLALDASPASVKLSAGCKAHFIVGGGAIIPCND